MINAAPKSLAVGGEGSGKSWLQWYMAKNEKWMVTLDLNNQQIFDEGAHVVRCKQSFLVAMSRAYKAKKKGLAYRVTWHVQKGSDFRNVADFAVRAIRRAGGMALFIDESESFIPCQRKLTDDMFELAKRARHETPIPLYMTAHKPMELHNKFRTNLSKMMVFYVEDDSTIKFLRAKKAIYHDTKAIRNLLKSLGEYEYLLDVKGQPLKKMKKIKIS